MKKHLYRTAYFLLGFSLAFLAPFATSGNVFYFGAGYVSAVICLRLLVFPTALGFIVGSLVSEFSFLSALSSLFCVLVSVVYALFFKKRKSLYLLLLFCFLSQGAFVYRVFAEGKTLPVALACVSVSLAVSYVTTLALSPFIRRGYQSKGELPLVCLAILLCVFSCSLSWFSAHYLVLLPICFLSGKTVGKTGAIVCAIAIGLGQAFFSLSVVFLSFAVFSVSLGIIFLSCPRAITVLVSVMAFAVFRLYFTVPYGGVLTDFILLTLGGAFYCVIPKKAITVLRGRFGGKQLSFASREVVRRNVEKNAFALERLGVIFAEMARAIRGTIATVTAEKTKERLENEVCADCTTCDRSCLSVLCDATARKNSVEVSDAPQLLAVGCPHSARLISLANEIAGRNSYLKNKRGTEERIKESVAFQLDNVSRIVMERALLQKQPLSFDCDNETVLREELALAGESVIDCAITKGEDGEIVIVFATAPNEQAVIDIADKVMLAKFGVVKSARDGQSGVYTLALKERPPYEVFFSASSRAKNPLATGDTHSFIKISDSKFMMALCDGMGSGEKAGKISETAIELVESYFKAGFDGEFIVDSVNRFLSKDSGETFTAFDILVCDLATLDRTIIKMGSPRSYVKSDKGVFSLDGNALPLGVVEEVRPFVRRDKISDGDVVTFVSDGVSDAFEKNALALLMLDVDERNVKNFTDTLLTSAIKRKNGKIEDDMTVISARIVRRI